jgi:hypothetical protein
VHSPVIFRAKALPQLCCSLLPYDQPGDHQHGDNRDYNHNRYFSSGIHRYPFHSQPIRFLKGMPGARKGVAQFLSLRAGVRGLPRKIEVKVAD